MTAALSRLPVRLRLVGEPGTECHYPAAGTNGRCIREACRHYLGAGDHRCVLEEIEQHGTLTLREIAPMLGLSFDRIRQIEEKSLRRKGVRYMLREWCGHTALRARSALAAIVQDNPDAERSESMGSLKFEESAPDEEGPTDPQRIVAIYRREPEVKRAIAVIEGLLGEIAESGTFEASGVVRDLAEMAEASGRVDETEQE